MDALLSPAIVQMGAAGLLAVVVLMVLTDRLVTKPRLVEAQAESSRWRKAWETEREKGDARDKQVTRLVAAVEASLESVCPCAHGHHGTPPTTDHRRPSETEA